ncbi:MAG TPA: hydrogenase 4 subunit B [Acetobacteraceae bacterium]|jgi:formate hydrogenlyase subunit 3/multisubunit Na+/H+ antiporter MnhD subunit
MIDLVLACVLLLFALAITGAAAARTPSGGRLVYGGSLLISLVLLAAGAASIPAAPSAETLPIGLPWIGGHMRLDALSAFFLVVVGLGSAAASLFAIGYGRHEPQPQRVLPFYPLFLAGLTLVVIADDAFIFLFSWELMSIASWALVLAHHREPGNARAALIYLLMAAFSGLTLLLAFGVLSGTAGSYAFDAMRAAHPTPWAAALVLVLALIGAGSKAGIVPLHVWLPLAHPAAPSHVSALMSGVMTKVAVYGFIRIVFTLLGVPAWWAGVVVLVLGGITAVLGVLYALMEHDLKRLLAYHTVENIGIIFIGLGLALAFAANNLQTAAALSLTAALFHVFNHSVFKSLLFFGSGAVLTATGERDMEHLGGLIHRMPQTAFCFLVGCAAISALPPLNGFVSEWLTFQAILLHPNLPQWGLKVAIPADGALLALSAALAAACFVKAFGVSFLGRPRSTAAAQAVEVDRWSLAAMFVLAAICLLAGIVPGVVIDALAPVAQALTGAHMPTQLGLDWLTIVPVAESRSSYNGLLIFVFIAASASLTAAAIHRFASRALRRGPAWDCGFPDASPAAQYTAASFAQPIRRVFGTVVFRTSETVTMPAPGDMAPARIEKTVHDPVWETLYAPIAGGVARAADLLNHLQFLTIRRYLGFVFAALVLLLLALALWQ